VGGGEMMVVGRERGLQLAGQLYLVSMKQLRKSCDTPPWKCSEKACAVFVEYEVVVLDSQEAPLFRNWDPVAGTPLGTGTAAAECPQEGGPCSPDFPPPFARHAILSTASPAGG
jgi:hypothetical protein